MAVNAGARNDRDTLYYTRVTLTMLRKLGTNTTITAYLSQHTPIRPKCKPLARKTAL